MFFPVSNFLVERFKSEYSEFVITFYVHMKIPRTIFPGEEINFFKDLFLCVERLNFQRFVPVCREIGFFKKLFHRCGEIKDFKLLFLCVKSLEFSRKQFPVVETLNFSRTSSLIKTLLRGSAATTSQIFHLWVSKILYGAVAAQTAFAP